MTTHAVCTREALLLAVDRPTEIFGQALPRVLGGERETTGGAVHIVLGAGDALRLIHRRDPQVLLVCVGRERLAESAPMIQVLRHRRPQLPLLAITPEHDESIERAVRAAGASYYFALDGAT